MFRFSRQHTRPANVQATWAVCSRVLDYPTPELLDDLDQLEALVPDDDNLATLLTHLRSHSLQELQQQYVATFDHTRRCALYLTYFAYGDTRRRGVALVQFKQAFRKAGVEFDESADELPDHLCGLATRCGVRRRCCLAFDAGPPSRHRDVAPSAGS
ncbi:MAG: nitrate reductase molybdenum cofactor assembly chaperone [Marmoricola sp.]